MPTELPDKTYFKIGEAATLVGVEPHTIRYWEKEFRAIRPAKTRSKQRLFRHKDIQLLLVIRHLLHGQRFTIDGARRKLKDLSGAGMSVEAILDAIESGRPLDPEVQAEAEDAAALGRALDEARAQIAAQRAEIERLEASDANELRAELARALATCDALRDTVDALRGDLAKARARIGSLEAQGRGGVELEELRADMRARWERVAGATAPRPRT